MPGLVLYKGNNCDFSRWSELFTRTLTLNRLRQCQVSFPTGGFLRHVRRELPCSVTVDLLSSKQMTSSAFSFTLAIIRLVAVRVLSPAESLVRMRENGACVFNRIVYVDGIFTANSISMSHFSRYDFSNLAPSFSITLHLGRSENIFT